MGNGAQDHAAPDRRTSKGSLTGGMRDVSEVRDGKEPGG